MVGLDGVWLTLATSYVEGAVLRPSVAAVAHAGRRTWAAALAGGLRWRGMLEWLGMLG